MDPETVEISARTGTALALSEGGCVKLINTFGSQVVDTWAFNAGDRHEFMSMEHSRSCLEKLAPAVGDSLFSNKRQAILTVVEDTSPGVHDMLLSACDAERYRLLGHHGHHANCVDNLKTALAEIGLEPPQIPSPWNVFENVAITADGRLEIRPPPARAGDYLVLRAEMDVIVVFSACPMDIVATNGPDCIPKAVHYRIRSGNGAA